MTDKAFILTGAHFERLHVEAYRESGYQVVHIPAASDAARVDGILAAVQRR